jgi:ADP-heptose:LPS heptosyltransferase
MQEKKKILIVRFSSIGDIVLTTPVLRSLKTQKPELEIHYLTKRSYCPVIEANPHIDKLYLIDNGIDEVIKELRREKYHHVVDLHKNIRSFGLKLRMGIPSSTFDKLNIKKYMLVNFRWNSLPDIHIVDRYFQAVKKFGVKNDNKGLDYFIPENATINSVDIPETHKKGYTGIVIGGNHFTKILPNDKIIGIIRGLDKPVILLGGQEDRSKGDEIKREFENLVYNACGELSINQSAILVRDADEIITNDTGLMHIAAAFRKRIISVWGNTVPEFGMYPYLPEDSMQNSTIIEVKGLSCRPCSKIGFSKCPKKHFRCMQEIDEEKIISQVKNR